MSDTPRRRGRPTSAEHPTITVTHRDTGKAIAWSDGEFAGDPDLLRLARIIRDGGEPVRVGPVLIHLDSSPAAAAAIMLAACGHRGILSHPDVLAAAIPPVDQEHLEPPIPSSAPAQEGAG